MVAQLPQLKAGRKKNQLNFENIQHIFKGNFESLFSKAGRRRRKRRKTQRCSSGRVFAAFGVALGEEVKLKRIVRIGIELHRFSWELHIEKKFRCWMPQAICVPFESFDSEDFPF